MLLASSAARAEEPKAPIVVSPAPPPRKHRQAEVMMVGVVVSIMGGALLFPGALVAANALGGQSYALPATGQESRFGVLGVSGGLIVVGVTLALVGGLPPSPPADGAKASAGWIPSLGFTPARSSGAASLTWRF